MPGYNSQNMSMLDKRFICPDCKLIFCDPVQFIDCGHRLCESCFASDNPLKFKYKCSQCPPDIPEQEIRPDRGFRNDLQSLLINCSFCQWSDQLKHYQNHLNQFHSHPKCADCDQQFDSIHDLNQHRHSQCQLIQLPCVLKDFGCFGLIFRRDLPNHYRGKQHQQAILKALDLTKSLPSNGHSTTTNDMTDDPDVEQIQQLRQAVNLLNIGEESIADDYEHLDQQLSQCRALAEALRQRVSQILLAEQETQHFLQGFEPNQAVLEQDLASLNDTIGDRKYISYDGTFIWKINRVREKRIDAQSERQTSVYSPPFYSAQSGYKMRMRLYLNGDGTARGTHISLFFVLMRSVNDAILKFPFDYKVTFCLYDQTPERRHIVDSFRPDIRSNSFQRPRSDMNIASGIPKFVPQSMIEDENSSYVKNDSMFIRIMIDFDNLPKSVIPYALSLNPGLPIHVQQTMIKQEIERRQQQTSVA